MKKLFIEITEELDQCLRHVGTESGERVGPLIERLLRKSTDIKAAQKALGIAWEDRRQIGRPAKTA